MREVHRAKTGLASYRNWAWYQAGDGRCERLDDGIDPARHTLARHQVQEGGADDKEWGLGRRLVLISLTEDVNKANW